MSAGNTAERKRPRRFLECVEDSFLTNTMVNKPNRGGALLFVGKEKLVVDVMVSGHLGPSDHELLVFSILAEVRRGKLLPWTWVSRLWPV